MINIQQKKRPEAFYSELIVDGIAFNKWLAEFVDKGIQLEGLDIEGLGLSLNLDSYSDTKIVWYYLGQLDEGDVSYVPLLVCPEDNDLSCTVITAEQHIIDNKVIWKRFGLLEGLIEEQNSNTIDWFKGIPELLFTKDNFEKIFRTFLNEFTETYRNTGEFIDIAFPITLLKIDNNYD